MIIVLGKNGQVGRALSRLLGPRAVVADSHSVNLLMHDFPARLDALAAGHTVTALINAAAYTAVDQAENEVEPAMRVNGHSVGLLGEWCRKHRAVLVHYSTDYVFNGSGTHAHHEGELPEPINVYGRSKLLGEQLAAASGADHLIFRTSWVYDDEGKNFLNTMRRLFREREEVRVVADQVGAPTYAWHLAQATLAALESAKAQEEFPSGIYHLCGGGEASWYDFAKDIFALASRYESGIKCYSIQPITTKDYPTPARRPLNSRLDCSKAKETLGVALPHWKDGLNECYESIRMRT